MTALLFVLYEHRVTRDRKESSVTREYRVSREFLVQRVRRVRPDRTDLTDLWEQQDRRDLRVRPGLRDRKERLVYRDRSVEREILVLTDLRVSY